MKTSLIINNSHIEMTRNSLLDITNDEGMGGRETLSSSLLFAVFVPKATHAEKSTTTLLNCNQSKIENPIAKHVVPFEFCLTSADGSASSSGCVATKRRRKHRSTIGTMSHRLPMSRS